MRYASLDLLRALAIVIMVVVHFTENLAGFTPAVAGLGAPMFMFLSGMSYRLWLNGRTTRSRTSTEVSQISARRGLFLIGLGFLFNILVWLPEDVFNWDVLTLIGLGLLTLGLVRKAPTSIIVLVCVLVYLSSPVLRDLVVWQDYWEQGYFDPDMTLTDVTLGFLLVGYFPVFPWIIFPLMGFVVGTHVFLPESDDRRRITALKKFGLIAFGLFALGCAMILLRAWRADMWPARWPNSWSMFPPSLEYVTLTLGWVLLAFVVSYYWLDMTNDETKAQMLRRVAERWSRHSLSVYVWHHVAHLWPLWTLAVWRGLEPTAYWQKATDVWTSLGLAIVFLIITHGLLLMVDRKRLPTAESAMRWLCG